MVVLFVASAELDGREVLEAAVRPIGVVFDPPRLDDDLGLEQRSELLDVEEPRLRVVLCRVRSRRVVAEIFWGPPGPTGSGYGAVALRAP